MKELKIIFKNLPPQPRNATHENHRLTDIARAYQDDIRDRLKKTGKKGFFSDCEAVIIDLTIYTPASQFLTQEKKLSKTSIDFDAHKLFIDEIAKFFDFNDGLVWDAKIMKLPIEGDEWVFKLKIKGQETKEWREVTIQTLKSSNPDFQILD